MKCGKPCTWLSLVVAIPALAICFSFVNADKKDEAAESDTAQPQAVESSTAETGAESHVAKAEASPRLPDWSLFRGDAQSSGVAVSELPDKLSVLWKFKVKDGAFESTPAIVGDRVYVGDLDGKVYCLDLATGKQEWEFKTEIGFVASPAVRDNKLFIGDLDGYFYCLDIKTGKQLWRFETNGEIDSSANFYEGHVLVGSQDATLYCLGMDDGKLIWKYEIEDQIRCSPTIVDHRVFLAGCDGKLHIIDLKTRKPDAAVVIHAPTGVTPAVAGTHTYFGTEGGVFFCIDWKNAKTVWTHELGGGQSFRSSAAVHKNVVVVGSRNKKVLAFNSQDGTPIWDFQTRGRVDCSPVIVGKRAYIGSSDGRLYGLNLSDGEKLWQYEAGGSFTGSPAVAKQRLVIANDDGIVYCFGAKGSS